MDWSSANFRFRSGSSCDEAAASIMALPNCRTESPKPPPLFDPLVPPPAVTAAPGLFRPPSPPRREVGHRHWLHEAIGRGAGHETVPAEVAVFIRPAHLQAACLGHRGVNIDGPVGPAGERVEHRDLSGEALDGVCLWQFRVGRGQGLGHRDGDGLLHPGSL